MIFDVAAALAAAVIAGACSPCAKSKRGVVIFTRDGILSLGSNHPPDPFRCDGSEACRSACAKLCIHAEEDALQHVIRSGIDFVATSWHREIKQASSAEIEIEMLHVKVVNGKAVPSGAPSCWQCSRSILGFGKIDRMWLLHADGLRGYTPLEFHEITLRNCHLPLIEDPR